MVVISKHSLYLLFILFIYFVVAKNTKFHTFKQTFFDTKLNEMVANPEKFQLIFFGIKEDQELSIEINGDVIKISDTVKLLGVTIDSKLRSNEHVKTICQKTNNKFKASSRVVRYLEPQKATLLYNSFILTNYNYCPLIWTLCGKR